MFCKKKMEFLKEVVLVDNKPKTIDYVVEDYRSMTDEGKGTKGYLNINIGKDQYEILVV